MMQKLFKDKCFRFQISFQRVHKILSDDNSIGSWDNIVTTISGLTFEGKIGYATFSPEFSFIQVFYSFIYFLVSFYFFYRAGHVCHLGAPSLIYNVLWCTCIRIKYYFRNLISLQNFCRNINNSKSNQTKTWYLKLNLVFSNHFSWSIQKKNWEQKPAQIHRELYDLK